jgi:hypothetical protein
VATHQRKQNSPPVRRKNRIGKQSPQIKDNETHPLLEEKFGSVSSVHTSLNEKTHHLCVPAMFEKQFDNGFMVSLGSYLQRTTVLPASCIDVRTVFKKQFDNGFTPLPGC